MSSSVPGLGQDTKNGHGPLLRQFTDNTITSLIAICQRKIEKEKILAQGLENFLERGVWYRGGAGRGGGGGEGQVPP